jgi:predicted AlkP superfamily pyrophosphatase or phosphodiesterase
VTRARPAIASAALALLLLLPAARAGADAPPRLVLVLVVDQLRRDRLDPALPGGLGRIAREGRVHTEGLLDHAITETCPGHATLLTGRHPGAAGIPGNRFIDAEAGRTVYCVEDRDAPVIGGDPGEVGEGGRSPRNLRVSALGDWMKAARPGTRVFAVGGKDRAAITLGGQRPDAAYWMLREGGPLGFTTSRYYRAELPAWVERFNARLARALPERWEHAVEGAPRPDDYRGESPEYRRESPHPLRDGNPEKLADNFSFTPHLDEKTIDFARELVEREDLGGGSAPDLLALGLSATDLIGHLYGPFSHESADALRRLDRALGSFLEFLEARLGAGRVLVALSADHGVLALPEWLAERGESRCPLEDGRAGLRWLVVGLGWELHRSLTWVLALPKGWVVVAGTQLAASRPVAQRQGVPVERIVGLVEAYLERRPYVTRVWTPAELESSDEEIARLYRNSRDPERSGDLLLQIEPTCLITPYGHGTTHGSPYSYDRAVPIAFWGPGIVPGRVAGPARTIDVAPTLARLLGVRPPGPIDGQPLPER